MHGTPPLQNARRPRFPPDGPSDPVVPPPRRVEAPQAVGAEPNAHGIVMTRHPTDPTARSWLRRGGGAMARGALQTRRPAVRSRSRRCRVCVGGWTSTVMRSGRTRRPDVRSRIRRAMALPMALWTVVTRRPDVRSRFRRAMALPMDLGTVVTRRPDVRAGSGGQAVDGTHDYLGHRRDPSPRRAEPDQAGDGTPNGRGDRRDHSPRRAVPVQLTGEAPNGLRERRDSRPAGPDGYSSRGSPIARRCDL